MVVRRSALDSFKILGRAPRIVLTAAIISLAFIQTCSAIPTPSASPLPDPANITLSKNEYYEKQLINECQGIWDRQKYTALWHYYQLTGQPDKIDPVLKRALSPPSWVCGTTALGWSQTALALCASLRKEHEIDLCNRCLPYAEGALYDPRTSNIDNPEEKTLRKLAEPGCFGKYDENYPNLLCVGCSTEACVNAIAQYSHPISFGIFPRDKWPPLTALRGDKNIERFELLSLGREALSILPSLNGLKKLVIKPELLKELDPITMSRLEAIDFEYGKLTEETFRIIARYPGIRSISSEFCSASDNALAPIQNSHTIKRLRFLRCPLKAKNIHYISTLSELESVKLEAASTNSMSKLARLRNIKKLSLFSNELSDADLSVVSQMPALESLEIRSSKITGWGFKYLLRLSKLKSLSIASECVQPKSLYYIAKLKSLEELDLFDCNFSPRLLVRLSILPNLHTIQFKFSRYADNWLPYLCTLPHIRKLDLSACMVSPNVLAQVAKLKDLETILLPQCPSLRERGFQIIREKLDNAPPITDADVRFLADLPNLKSIVANSTAVTGKIFEHGFKRLEEADLRWSPTADVSLIYLSRLPALKKLHLSGEALTANTIGSLRAREQFEELSIVHYKHSEIDTDIFSTFYKLRTLNLSGTRFSLEKLHLLKEKLPACKICPDPDELEKTLSNALKS